MIQTTIRPRAPQPAEVEISPHPELVAHLVIVRILSVSILAAALLMTSSLSAEERLNRLATEKSPYLLQHATNPVDWYPWGEEAFAKAEKTGRLVFLSIGYSTCHWCHVMEEESFESEEVAAVLNEKFVSVKVDREERPDIDALYMAYLRATTGEGGWPLNVVLTPDGKPIFGGTYFPPTTTQGRTGLIEVLTRLAGAWEGGRDGLEAMASSTMEMIRAGERSSESGELDPAHLERAADAYMAAFDAEHGGFGAAPKFPQPVDLEFLLRRFADSGRAPELRAVRRTLDAIALGGLHDHIGGGFHRYAVDAAWRVPHFEKMLYDQAQLAIVFIEAAQLTGEADLAAPARGALDYVRREMTSPSGGFFSAEDADSLDRNEEKREGAFYTWTAAELEKLLGKSYPAFALRFGVRRNGNVPESLDPSGELTGINVLRIEKTIPEVAGILERSEEEVVRQLDEARGILRDAREERSRPHLDDKILSSWNGLMISAFARGAAFFDDDEYETTALRAARFLDTEMVDRESGTLFRRHRDGETGIDGFADDYSFVIQGYIDLYETSFEIEWLVRAVEMQKWMIERFYDAESETFRYSTGSDPLVIHEVASIVDAAEPSFASVAALNLLRLGEMTDDDEFRKIGAKIVESAAGQLATAPRTLPKMLTALDFALSKPKQIVVAGKAGTPTTERMLRVINDRFIPKKVLLLADGGAGQQRLTEWMPFIEYMTPPDDAAMVFVCENYVCKLPSTDPEVIAGMLDEAPSAEEGTE